MELSSHQRRPTFLFVLPWSLRHVGGVNQVVKNLAKQISSKGIYQPVVLITDWDATTPIWGEEEGVQTVRWRIRGYHRGMSIKERVAFMLWERRFSRKFHEFCRENNVVAINQHYVGDTAFSINRVRLKSDGHIPFILSFHGSDLTHLISSGEKDLEQWRRLLSHIDKIIVCSNDLKDRVTTLLGEKLDIQVIFNGLDAANFAGFARSTEPASERIVLNVAKFEKYKGQDVLIEAFKIIANEFSDVKLFLVGADGKELSCLKQLADRSEIAGRVFFFPNTPHRKVAEFFRKSSIFVLPSRQEAFGIVLLEAGAFRVPVVASSVGGIPEIITNGENGILVSPDDPNELAHSIRSLLKSPSTATELGDSLHRHVLSNFTWTSAYEKYVAILDH